MLITTAEIFRYSLVSFKAGLYSRFGHLEPFRPITESFHEAGLEARGCAKYSGFRIILTSLEFIHNLSMYDALSELSDLSE